MQRRASSSRTASAKARLCSWERSISTPDAVSGNGFLPKLRTNPHTRRVDRLGNAGRDNKFAKAPLERRAEMTENVGIPRILAYPLFPRLFTESEMRTVVLDRTAVLFVGVAMGVMIGLAFASHAPSAPRAKPAASAVATLC